MRIAIIGAGIGGCSCARFAREAFGENAVIDVYERWDRVGGRAATVEVTAGEEHEAGASIIHSRNRYMVDFAKELGIQKLPSDKRLLGIYNGRQFTFTESTYTLITLKRLLCRYGFDVFRAKKWVEAFVTKFESIYDLQQRGAAFTTPQKLLAALDQRFPHLVVGETIEGYLRAEGFCENFIKDFVTAIMRVNYGQSANIGAFVGAVSMAGMFGELWAAEGGNRLIAEGILKKSGANIKLRTNVEKVVGADNGAYTLVVRCLETGAVTEGGYDIVFLAVPLKSNTDGKKMVFENIPTAKSVESLSRKYHRTVTTFVKGELNRKVLTQGGDQPKPQMILTTSERANFNSLSIHSPTKLTSRSNDTSPVWKFFTQQPLSQAQIKEYFPHTEVKQTISWQAYPSYMTREERENVVPFCVDENNFFYINAVEGTASALEMSVIGARNCVLLAKNRHDNNLTNIDPSQPVCSKL